MSTYPILIEYRATSQLGEITWPDVQSSATRFNAMRFASEISMGVPEELKLSNLHRRVETIADLDGIEMSPVDDAGPMFQIKGLDINENYQPVPVSSSDEFSQIAFSTRKFSSLQDDEKFLVSANATEEAINELMKHPDVIEIWEDSQLSPFDEAEPITFCPADLKPGPNDPLATVEEIRIQLGFADLNQSGLRGQDVAVAIVDTGMDLTKLAKINKGVRDRVVNGWPVKREGRVAKWGTHRSNSNPHAENSAEAIGDLAPDVRLWDVRITNVKSYSSFGQSGDKPFISATIAAFDWLLEQYKLALASGTTPLPKVVNCSWGLYRRDQGRQYFGNPNHPLVLKTLEMIRAGMIVVFAAGNCGKPCAASDCLLDQGPGKSILGVNGHEDVICVTSSTLDSRYIPYSSQGPSTMAVEKRNPDICGVSHYQTKGGVFFNGTSAATPVVSAAAALMVQGFPESTQFDLQIVLTETADSSGFQAPTDHPQYVGHGLIQPTKAFEELSRLMKNS